MDHAVLIDKAGGCREVSRLTGRTLEAVRKWRLRGRIPLQFLAQVAIAAGERPHDVCPKVFPAEQSA